MRDDETGSWWQQVTGEAIYGPLKGQRLRPVVHDELTFALWKRETPSGRVLRPDNAVLAAGKYAPADWEARMQNVKVTTSRLVDTALSARTLVVGVKVNGAARAYPLEALQKQSPVLDDLGGVPIMLVMAEDGKSVRAFERVVNGRKLEFFARPQSAELRLVDAETGSEWNFSGKAIRGTLSGQQLRKLAVLNDYWFDWQTYNPTSTIYELGARQ